LVSIPSTSGKPVRLKELKNYANGRSLNPFNIREAGQTNRKMEKSGDVGLNPFNIREAGQTDRPEFFNADKHLRRGLKANRGSEKLTVGMGLVHGSV
jgi:hypothetical protein